MVMKNIMRKNLKQSIVKSIGRYIAIMAIIALGSGMFVGLRVTRTDMVATGQQYTDSQNMFDLRLVNSYGWSDEDVQTVAAMDGIESAEGGRFLDAFIAQNDGEKDAVYRIHSVPKTVSKVYLLGGRMPTKPDECLVDGSNATDALLGTKITISENNDKKTLESLHERIFTVVGYISTPIYMDTSRGSTSIGDGTIDNYLYIPEEAFAVDYFTEINVTIPGQWQIYTSSYKKAMDTAAEQMKDAVAALAHNRYATVKQAGEEEYAAGLQEYENGRKEYQQKKDEALVELADALRKLQEGEAQLKANQEKITDGERQLQDASRLLEENTKKLAASRLELDTGKKETYGKLDATKTELLNNYNAVSSGLKQVQSGLDQIRPGIRQIDEGIAQLDDGLNQINANLPNLNTMIELLNTDVKLSQMALEIAEQTPDTPEDVIAGIREHLNEQTAKLEEMTAQREEALAMKMDLEQKRLDLVNQRQALDAKRMELEQTQTTLTESMGKIDQGFEEYKKGLAEADSRFASAEAMLSEGERELEKGRAELKKQTGVLEEVKQALADAQKELDSGRTEYESGKAEAEAEFAKAEAELNDAQVQLNDARKTLNEMAEPDSYVLTRETNMGYTALDSNSNILAGVARVLPLFFMLVAALVCITTMTRMVEEERTQIGTLKAMGYGNGTIMWKYLFYSGSAAILGCSFGALIGSVAFPWILWDTYKVMFNITPRVVLTINWPLCIAVVAGYTAVSLLVTWYTCRKTLREVPAELIRPKAPAAGRKILLERLPFWNKFSFLNKVTLRNVFRYRQRMLMMLVGIGGCTALLLTGFGVRDSIGHIVDYQFEDIAHYDMEVYFSDSLDDTAKQQFADAVGTDAERIGFFYQSQVELTHGGRTWNINLTAMNEDSAGFIDFHRGKKAVALPGLDEALVSVGAAEALDISVGDELTVYDTDMQKLTVRVSGIYDNHVSNYIMVSPDTLAHQWGKAPGCQMAYVIAADGVDIGALSTSISEQTSVMNVTVSEEVAQMVNTMLDALDMVVVTIVICAGLLAVIVLYNLTNINITERIREIATIKVLGFNSKETSAYVFKENILLSVMGAALGLLGGKFLLDFVIHQVKIDLVWFLPKLLWPSYVYAIVLTLVSAAVVDAVFYFRLEKINMAEALKSVE